MKKILVIALSFALLFSVACKAGGQTGPSEEEIGDLKEALTDIVEKAGMKDLLEGGMLEPVEKDEAGFLIGAESIEGSFEEAYSLQPMINVHAFAMGLFRVAEGQDPVAFGRELKDKADLRKWICVEAETMTVATKGRAVLIVMGSAEEVEAIAGAAGFNPIG